jgi:hypothetical protein
MFGHGCFDCMPDGGVVFCVCDGVLGVVVVVLGVVVVLELVAAEAPAMPAAAPPVASAPATIVAWSILDMRIW